MNALYRHAKFQAPVAQLRDRVSSIWRGAGSVLNFYERMLSEEKEVVEGDVAPFKGDIPLGAGDTHNQISLNFARPRPVMERVENLVVTPEGAGWKDGRLVERYSASKPGLRMLAGKRRPDRVAPKGYFVQSEHTDTFGDWMSEYLSPLAHLPEITAPVYLPRALARKPYVRRDGERTGIEFTEIEAPILIRDAIVVRQQRFIRYWREKDVEALSRLLSVRAVTPKQGSMLYLSRHGEVSEVADRTHPSLMVEEIVKERGGVVLRTKDASLEKYLEAAQWAETILFDHGSAAYNMIYWSPRRAIEFASDAWWMNSFLFFANASGVKDYTLICTDRGNLDSVRDRINAALDAPIGME